MKDIQLINEEVWKDIPGFDFYEASSLGRIRSKDHYAFVRNGHKAIHQGKIIKPSVQNNGYLLVWLRQNGKTICKSVHRLVASTFIPQIAGKDFVNHKDGNKTNNSIDNLEWVSRTENLIHSYRVLHQRRNDQKVRCLDTGKIYFSAREAERENKLCKGSVCNAVNGHSKTAGGLKWEKIQK